MRLSAVAEERHQSADSPELSTTDEPPQEEPNAADELQLKTNMPTGQGGTGKDWGRIVWTLGVVLSRWNGRNCAWSFH
jgi:hypothetical protein